MKKFLKKVRYKIFHLLNSRIFGRSRNSLSSADIPCSSGRINLQEILPLVKSEFGLLVDHSKKKEYAFEINKSEVLYEEIINEADDIVQNKIHLFGSDHEYGEHINWHLDKVSGFQWKDEYCTKVKIIDFDNESDVKFPWELNRLHFTVRLGIAYFLTQEPKYCRKFDEIIGSWIESNPKYYGINWSSPLEVAIRLINLLWAYAFFIHSECLSEERHSLIHAMIHFHAVFLRKNLENRGVVNHNHYMGNILGLYYFGVLFSAYSSAKRMKSFAVRELRREVLAQTFKDGVNFELSTGYHIFTTEMVLHSLILNYLESGKNSAGSSPDTFEDAAVKTFGEEYLSVFKKSIHFLDCIIKPDLSVSHIGDCDSGTVLRFSQRGKRHHLSILNTCCAILNITRGGGEVFDVDEYSTWLTKFLPQTSKKSSMVLEGSQSFEESGFFVMRSDRSHLITRCGLIGTKGKGSHIHNDNLSFELTMDGQPLIVDRGTYTYTRDPGSRHEFRSTKSHNTVCIENVEQNLQPEQDLFSMTINSSPRTLKWLTSDEYVEYSGQVSYDINGENAVHQREIVFDKVENVFNFKDTILGKKDISVLWTMYFDAGAFVEANGNFVRIETGPGYEYLLAFQSEESLDFKVEKTTVSSGYDNLISAMKMSCEVLISPPYYLSYTVKPGKKK